MNSRILVRTSVELSRILTDRIVYVHSDGNYSTFVIANGEERTVTLQLGEIEELMSEQLESNGNNFIRIGRCLIVNYNYIYHINVSRQQLILSDNATFTYTLSASKEALKKLKEYVEEKHKIN
ncbi:MAG: LytTR family transcriptional regulator DNA-binding domain-containing protein [Muribaculaceae bacterium]|nr:LytTR family transcriptional regulator DNA-binding domain-containing protein [Muribaculaceae bacterium]MBQ5697796.1 LytTR family transcriptional regulator DNA-binding domain-containing protein [Muribaculaceae bacterium]